MTTVAFADPSTPACMPGVARDSAAVFADVGAQRHQTATSAEIVELVGGLADAGEGVNAGDGRRRGTALLLRCLSGFEGATWQQRWEASGLEAAGPAGFRQLVCDQTGLPASPSRLWLLSSGLGSLLALDVVRPSFEFVLGARLNHCWSRLLGWRHDPHADILNRVPCTSQTRSQATALLARLVVVTGRPVAELTAADLLAFRAGVLSRRNQSVGLAHLWLCLADLGTVEGSLHQALRRGQRSVTELVDPYDLASRPVRNLLVAYLAERSVSVDYSTLRCLVTDLCLRFWKQIEQIAPGIDSIDLPDDVADEWKRTARWRTTPNGARVPRR